MAWCTSASWPISASSRPKISSKLAMKSWSSAWAWTKRDACVFHAEPLWPNATSRWVEPAKAAVAAVAAVKTRKAVTRGSPLHAVNTAESVENIAASAVSTVGIVASGAAVTEVANGAPEIVASADRQSGQETDRPTAEVLEDPTGAVIEEATAAGNPPADAG